MIQFGIYIGETTGVLDCEQIVLSLCVILNSSVQFEKLNNLAEHWDEEFRVWFRLHERCLEQQMNHTNNNNATMTSDVDIKIGQPYLLENHAEDTSLNRLHSFQEKVSTFHRGEEGQEKYKSSSKLRSHRVGGATEEELEYLREEWC